ncbi:MAG: glycosyltransferase family 2 protein, partial [Alcaligenaceae bacterium]
MSSARVKLAVIIVSYRNADDVDRCLQSLALSDLDQFEVFIC